MVRLGRMTFCWLAIGAGERRASRLEAAAPLRMRCQYPLRTISYNHAADKRILRLSALYVDHTCLAGSARFQCAGAAVCRVNNIPPSQANSLQTLIPRSTKRAWQLRAQPLTQTSEAPASTPRTCTPRSFPLQSTRRDSQTLSSASMPASTGTRPRNSLPST